MSIALRSGQPSLELARDDGLRVDNANVPVNHYENFPVASWLCPARLRPAVAAIYHFARTADDIADEGQADAQARLADLATFRADLFAAAEGASASPRWPDVFDPLRPVLAQFRLPLNLLTDLLSAFEQDVRKASYCGRSELLDYCRRSANPIGRLMLHLYGIDDELALARSDAICTALQLTNFWQDLGVDVSRGRYYVPQEDCKRHGVAAQPLWDCSDTSQSSAVVADLVRWARGLMLGGAPLVHQVKGLAGWELRFVVQGGLRILEKIDRLNGATIGTRPTLGPRDAPLLIWRALTMRPSGAFAAPAFL
jgi:squalene synthase HpnC